MNRQEIEKMFDEIFDWEIDRIKRDNVKSLFFDEILPDILRDLLWNPLEDTKSDVLDFERWAVFGSNARYRKVKLEAKEKYNINL